MKFIFVLLSLLVAINAQDLNKLHQIMKKCQEEVHIPEETLNHLKKLEEPHAAVETKYLFCFAKTIGGIDSEGHIHKAEMKTYLETLLKGDTATLDKFLKECTVEQKTLEETVLHTYGCALTTLGPYLAKLS